MNENVCGYCVWYYGYDKNDGFCRRSGVWSVKNDISAVHKDSTACPAFEEAEDDKDKIHLDYCGYPEE